MRSRRGRADDADKRYIGEVQAFRYHLSPNKDVRLAFAESTEDSGVRALAGGVTVHTSHAHPENTFGLLLPRAPCRFQIRGFWSPCRTGKQWARGGHNRSDGI